MRRRARLIVAVLAVAVLALAGSSASAAPRGSGRKAAGSITVFAASSLTEAFTKIGKDFEKKHPDATVTFSFNSSSTLETQIEQGAPTDVFASADDANMQKLVDADAIAGDPAVFARNRLEIAVEPRNPKKIESLADTVKGGVTLVLCVSEVPCGKYARQAYDKAGVSVPPVPTAENAKATLSKVTLGEADAAVVYVTDVKAAKGDASGVKIPAAQNVVAVYPIAPLVDAQDGPLAKAFIRYVLSSSAQRTLGRFGFLHP